MLTPEDLTNDLLLKIKSLIGDRKNVDVTISLKGYNEN